MNYLEIAKSCGARVNLRHLHKDGWRLNSAEVNSVNLTPDQLHAYTEQVCKKMVEALNAILEYGWYATAEVRNVIAKGLNHARH